MDDLESNLTISEKRSLALLDFLTENSELFSPSLEEIELNDLESEITSTPEFMGGVFILEIKMGNSFVLSDIRLPNTSYFHALGMIKSEGNYGENER